MHLLCLSELAPGEAILNPYADSIDLHLHGASQQQSFQQLKKCMWKSALPLKDETLRESRAPPVIRALGSIGSLGVPSLGLSFAKCSA